MWPFTSDVIVFKIQPKHPFSLNQGPPVVPSGVFKHTGAAQAWNDLGGKGH